MLTIADGGLDTHDIIEEYYQPKSIAYDILIHHGELVAQKALDVARSVPHFSPKLSFIYEAAMLHDIGIFMTHAPGLGCYGEHPYICHGVLGKKLLDGISLPQHAHVSERHVGAGITADEIKSQALPLPERDMVPKTVEERIICYADKFFSKGAGSGREKTVEEILAGLEPYGEGQVSSFLSLVKAFHIN